MALDKLVDSSQLDSDLTSVANAIRAKSGGSGQLAFPAGFVSEIGSIPTGGQSNFVLIGTKVFSNVPEYTNASAWDTTRDTEIDIKNTDYAWGYVIITCDSPITTSTEWGMTVCLWGRYKSNGSIYRGTNLMQKGSSTLSEAAVVSNVTDANSYGVSIPTNAATVKLDRKCHATGCPKIRAGTYTVKVYGMTGI